MDEYDVVALQSGEWLANELAGKFGSDREIDRALVRYRRRHRRALAAHHWLICDYATGRPLNHFENVMFTAAAHARWRAAVHALLSRMARRSASSHRLCSHGPGG